MSFNAKTIGISVAALLAVAGGAYAFMPNGQEDPSDSHAAVSMTQPVVEPQMTDPQGQPSKADGQTANVEVVNAPIAQQPVAQDQPAAQAPKKLTRAQLTPPPATENEKLEKAAEQESNF